MFIFVLQQIKKTQQQCCCVLKFHINLLFCFNGFSAVSSIDKMLNSVNEKQYEELNESKRTYQRKGPERKSENVCCSAALHKVQSMEEACVTETGNDNGFNYMDNSEPNAAELLGEHINKHVNPNMSLFDLEHRNRKHSYYDKEVGRKLITSLDGNGLTTYLTKNNVNCNNKNHDKSHSHRNVVEATNNLTNSIANFFQEAYPFLSNNEKISKIPNPGLTGFGI